MGGETAICASVGVPGVGAGTGIDTEVGGLETDMVGLK